MTTEWWAPELHPALSQGDVLGVLPMATLVAPAVALTKSEERGSRAWKEAPTWTPDADGLSYCLARGRRVAVMVLSHSCELDKGESKKRVLVAPIFSMAELPEAQRTQVAAQMRASRLALPAIPSFGDGFADLRVMTSIDRRLIDAAAKLASITEAGRQRLCTQLIGFLTRLELDDAAVPAVAE